jgi:hypothetical protein
LSWTRCNSNGFSIAADFEFAKQSDFQHLA